MEVSILEVTSDDKEVLKWPSHRGDDIGKEEVAESDLAKRWNNYVQKSLCQLDAATKVKAVHRHQANREEKHEQDNREVLHTAVVKLRCKLNHSYLPCEAEEPQERENKGNFIQLMVDHFVVLVDFEDERVIHIVASKDLHREPCRKHNEADHWRKVVRVHRREKHTPIVLSLHRLAKAQKDEEASKHNKPTSEKAHKVRVFDSNLVVLCVQLVLSFT